MPVIAEITVSRVQHVTLRDAPRLNPRFAPDGPLLLATLEVRWDPAEPLKAIADLEEILLSFSPGFLQHQCRGMGEYHVFSRLSGKGEVDSSISREAILASHPRQPYDAELALAHLLEHAVIDFQCEVTGETTCSGATGAHRSMRHRYDLMVECREFAIGSCCLALALEWIQNGLEGQRMGSVEREVLDALRWIHRYRPPAVFSTDLARALEWNEDRAERALEALRETGYFQVVSYTTNFSGLREYRARSGGRPGIL